MDILYYDVLHYLFTAVCCSRFQVAFHSPILKFVFDIANYITKFEILRWNLQANFTSCFKLKYNNMEPK